MLWCIKVLIGLNFNVSGVLFTLPPKKELHLLDNRPSTLPVYKLDSIYTIFFLPLLNILYTFFVIVTLKLFIPVRSVKILAG